MRRPSDPANNMRKHPVSKYNAFDSKLLGLIREGIGTFGALAQLML